MKTYFKFTVFLSFSIGLFLFACQSNKDLKTESETAEKQIYKAVGVIKNVDTDAGKLMIDHEDIANYMSAMVMDFELQNKNSVSEFKIGDKVDFEIERTGEKLLITKITKIGEVAILNGGEIYKISCAICHGANGEGTKKGLSFLKGHALHHSESEFIKQVTNGEGEKMPAFKDKLSTEQIAEVVKFVRSDIQKSVVKEKITDHKH